MGNTDSEARGSTSLGMYLRWLQLPPLIVRLRCWSSPIGAVIACDGKTPMTPMIPTFLPACVAHKSDCEGPVRGPHEKQPL